MSDSSDSRFSVIEVTNSGHCAVVEFREEDHTLCNALRFVTTTTETLLQCKPIVFRLTPLLLGLLSVTPNHLGFTRIEIGIRLMECSRV